MNVSAHPAPIIQPGTTGFVSTIGSSPFRLTHAQDRMTQPLRSTDITPLQRYYELLRPGAAHRYSGSRGVTHLSFSLSIATTGSHVPQQSLKQRHATFTPDTIQPISRLPLDSSQATALDPVLMSPVFHFDASSVVRLRSSHRISHDAYNDAFSLTLTTLTLNQSSLGLFKASPCRATLEDLPPSLLKLRHLQNSCFLHASWHTECVKTQNDKSRW